jgi:hypothetical protein
VKVLIGVFLAAAMLITFAATVLTDIKLWGLVRESRKSFRALPPDKRCGFLLRLAAIYGLAFGYLALILIAPFGMRKTLTYFVIVPFVIILPVAVIAAGIRGFRGQRHRRPPSA